MSSFTVPIAVAASPEGPFEAFEAIVDTGAFYTWLPRSVLRHLGLRPTRTRQFGTADGRIILREITWISIRLDGEVQPTICVFGDEGTVPLLGAFTLEGFGLAVDPVNKKLLPIPTLPMVGFLPSL